MKEVIKKAIKSIIYGDHLPCYVISDDPQIVICYWFDFVSDYEKIKTSLSNGVTLLFQLGWHVENKERISEIQEGMDEVKLKGFAADFIFLANSPLEKNTLIEHGYNAEFCHQNAFLDEKNYPLQRSLKKVYDAIYIARLSPFKRHALAVKVEKLRLIGDYHQHEDEYFSEIMASLSHANWERKVLASKVFKEIGQARVGLCLSQEEGAMFVSTEYLLCGIPIVSTKARGGRCELFDEYSCLIVDDSPDAVKKGVEEMKRRELSPVQIREKVLAQINSHREKFILIIQRIYDKKSVGRDFMKEWPDVFYHKFGLRSSPTREVIKKRMLHNRH